MIELYAHLKVHIAIGRHQEAFVFQPPLQPNVYRLASELLHKWLWVDWVDLYIKINQTDQVSLGHATKRSAVRTADMVVVKQETRAKYRTDAQTLRFAYIGHPPNAGTATPFCRALPNTSV